MNYEKLTTPENKLVTIYHTNYKLQITNCKMPLILNLELTIQIHDSNIFESSTIKFREIEFSVTNEHLIDRHNTSHLSGKYTLTPRTIGQAVSFAETNNPNIQISLTTIGLFRLYEIIYSALNILPQDIATRIIVVKNHLQEQLNDELPMKLFNSAALVKQSNKQILINIIRYINARTNQLLSKDTVDPDEILKQYDLVDKYSNSLLLSDDKHAVEFIEIMKCYILTDNVMEYIIDIVNSNNSSSNNHNLHLQINE